MKQVSLEFCENSVYGKQKRVIFLRVGKQKKSEKLDIFHTDVWEPSQVQYLGGSRYNVTFIDNATRKTWVFCIRPKYDVFLLLRNGKIWLRMRQEKS